MSSLRRTFFTRKSVRKILIDTIIIFVACLLVFWLIPQNVAFFGLASVHQTFTQKALHSSLAWILIILFRILVMVYKQPWNMTKTLQYLNIIVADVFAGLVYCIITEFAMGSVYPFLLTLVLFAVIDILTLFMRLLYKGLIEDYIEMIQKDGES